ncbi:MAG: rhomboid family intramembrane serine protease [Pseudomonadota bacterium]
MQHNFRYSAAGALAVIGLLWLLALLDQGLDLRLYRLGIYPRALIGLPGILFAPLIHGSWGHLISNSFALLVLLTTLLYGYPRSARAALALIWLGSNLCVWLFARASWHFGASGLTHGIMFYIFTSGILRRDRPSIALALIVFLLYGGMIWTIFPQQPDISYESHFFGAAAGVLAALLFAHRDPRPPGRHYDWEDAENDTTLPVEPGDRPVNPADRRHAAAATAADNRPAPD